MVLSKLVVLTKNKEPRTPMKLQNIFNQSHCQQFIWNKEKGQLDNPITTRLLFSLLFYSQFLGIVCFLTAFSEEEKDLSGKISFYVVLSELKLKHVIILKSQKDINKIFHTVETSSQSHDDLNFFNHLNTKYVEQYRRQS